MTRCFLFENIVIFGFVEILEKMAERSEAKIAKQSFARKIEI